jgi:ribonucleoside-diphosphate reductase alpha chain
MGDNTIHYDGPRADDGAVQPFISGAISKTVNMPEDATVEDVERSTSLAWQLGLKAVAIYRDNCKVGQPLSTAKKDGARPVAVPQAATQVVERIVEKIVENQPTRQKLPRNRRRAPSSSAWPTARASPPSASTPTAAPARSSSRCPSRAPRSAASWTRFAISISYGLQYGVPLRAFVEAFTNMRFEPAGMTDDPDCASPRRSWTTCSAAWRSST